MSYPIHPNSAAIVDAYKKGDKVVVIAYEHNVHPTSVRRIIIREGVQPRPPHRIKKEPDGI